MSTETLRPFASDIPREPLRVLHVVDAAAFAQLGPMIRGLLLELQTRQITPVVLTDDVPSAEALLGGRMELHALPTFRGWRAWQLERHLVARFEPRPQLVHVWGAVALRTFVRWTRSANLPLIVGALRAADVSHCRRYAAAEHVHYVGLCRAFAEQLGHLHPSRAGMVPLRPPVLEPPTASAIRKPLAGPAAIAWHGCFDDAARLDVLVEAVAVLHRQNVEAQVALVGNGQGECSIWPRIRELGVTHCFSVVDGRGFAELAVKGADVLVLPAPETAPSLTPLLAMASGVYVVAALGQPAEWFVDGETALQFAPGSAKELAYQLTRVIEQRPGVRDLVESAAKYVRSMHALDDHSAAWERLYRDWQHQPARDGVGQ